MPKDERHARIPAAFRCAGRAKQELRLAASSLKSAYPRGTDDLVEAEPRQRAFDDVLGPMSLRIGTVIGPLHETRAIAKTAKQFAQRPHIEIIDVVIEIIIPFQPPQAGQAAAGIRHFDDDQPVGLRNVLQNIKVVV